jgi:hypothetical protein
MASTKPINYRGHQAAAHHADTLHSDACVKKLTITLVAVWDRLESGSAKYWREPDERFAHYHASRLLQEGFKLLATGSFLKTTERFDFDLANSLAGDAELATDFFQRVV